MNKANTEEENLWSIELWKSVEKLVEHQENAAKLIILKNWIESGKHLQRKNMAGAARALWKLWNDFKNLRIENDPIKRNKRIDQHYNLTQIVIHSSF